MIIIIIQVKWVKQISEIVILLSMLIKQGILFLEKCILVTDILWMQQEKYMMFQV